MRFSTDSAGAGIPGAVPFTDKVANISISARIRASSSSFDLNLTQGATGPQGPAGPGGANLVTFRHTRTALNTCGPFNNFSFIDDPSINGNGNAMIFVTAIVGMDGTGSNTNPNSNMNLTYTGSVPFGTPGTACPAERWVIAGGDISVGAQFNVMLVGP